MEVSVNTDQKIMGALCYLSILWLAPFLGRREDPYVKFHLNQGIVVMIASVSLRFVNFFLRLILGRVGRMVGTFLSLAVFAYIVIGVYYAVSGKMKALPLLEDVNIIN